MYYFPLGKYDNHLFKILLENFYGKNILDRIGAIKNNNNENETEPDVQSAATQKRADDWGDIYDKVEQEHLNKNMLGAHQGWKRTAEVILRGCSIIIMVKTFMNICLNDYRFKYCSFYRATIHHYRKKKNRNWGNMISAFWLDLKVLNFTLKYS